MSNRTYWSKANLDAEQKDKLIERYEEVLLVIAQKQGMALVKEAMDYVEERFPDPSLVKMAAEMPDVTWEPKDFNEFEVSQRQQQLQGHFDL